MSVLDELACSLGRQDEVPNRELARRLAEREDRGSIAEIATALWSKDRNIQADCLKVLYEIAFLKPELVAGFAEDFIRLLRSKNNRLVWGAMIALSAVAGVAADPIYAHLTEIKKAMGHGSVITVDAAVLTLAQLASSSPQRNGEIFPYLLEHLRTCRPKDVPQHAEKSLVAVNGSNQRAFVEVLEARLHHLAGTQISRVRRVIRKASVL